MYEIKKIIKSRSGPGNLRPWIQCSLKILIPNIDVKILTLEKQTRHQRAFLETQFEKLTLNTKDFENWTSLGDISARAYTLGLKLLALMPQNGSWIPPSTSRASPRKVGALPLSNF